MLGYLCGSGIIDHTGYPSSAPTGAGKQVSEMVVPSSTPINKVGGRLSPYSCQLGTFCLFYFSHFDGRIVVLRYDFNLIFLMT